jgi:hypothetical protein
MQLQGYLRAPTAFIPQNVHPASLDTHAYTEVNYLQDMKGHNVVYQLTDVSEECKVSFFRVKE